MDKSVVMCACGHPKSEHLPLSHYCTNTQVDCHCLGFEPVEPQEATSQDDEAICMGHSGMTVEEALTHRCHPIAKEATLQAVLRNAAWGLSMVERNAIADALDANQRLIDDLASGTPLCVHYIDGEGVCAKPEGHINHRGGYVPWGNDPSVHPHPFKATASVETRLLSVTESRLPDNNVAVKEIGLLREAAAEMRRLREQVSNLKG